ncbi:unnamed protein product [Didymodactylos carnosus]|uniref:Zinc finger, C4 type n=1 Tax=Didymodactylos carnosus TaxID=1234261 RepID=A0A8S2HB25_9BILA|nr:unnamed protein product [Didymodactylos carnosus]CAF3600240.1 unnamed protein product [Didymodactylos carnosus]
MQCFAIDYDDNSTSQSNHNSDLDNNDNVPETKTRKPKIAFPFGRWCKSCRFQKCIKQGMSVDAVRMGRIPKVLKEKALREQHLRENAYNNLQRSLSDENSENYDPSQMQVDQEIASNVSEVPAITVVKTTSKASPVENWQLNQSLSNSSSFFHTPSQTHSPAPGHYSTSPEFLKTNFNRHHFTDSSYESSLEKSPQLKSNIFERDDLAFLPEDFSMDETNPRFDMNAWLNEADQATVRHLSTDALKKIKRISMKILKVNVFQELDEEESTFVRYQTMI